MIYTVTFNPSLDYIVAVDDLKLGATNRTSYEGMNVARFNFSHGSYDEHHGRIERVRRISKELGMPVGILLDTKGPEVRTGLLVDGKKVAVKTGDKIVVTAQPTSEDFHGTSEHISLDYLALPSEVEKGSLILIDERKFIFAANTSFDNGYTVTFSGDFKSFDRLFVCF